MDDRSTMRAVGATLGWMFAMIGLSGCGGIPQGNLDAAIKAREDVAVLQQETSAIMSRYLAAGNSDPDVTRVFRKITTQAEAKQEGGHILLARNKYDQAAKAYQEASQFYRKAHYWGKNEKAFVALRQQVLVSRILAEAALYGSNHVGHSETFEKAKKRESSAKDFFDDGDVEQALRELKNACQAYISIFPEQDSSNLEGAIAARAAMLATRGRIPRLSANPQDRGNTNQTPIDMTDGIAGLLRRADGFDRAATTALQQRDYPRARSLFMAADRLYDVVASRGDVMSLKKQADAAFKGVARTASYASGEQALADADKALEEDDFHAAQTALTTAMNKFRVACGEAEYVKPLAEAQAAWAEAVAAIDESLMIRYAGDEWAAAKANVAEAQAKANAGDARSAVSLYKEALALVDACKAKPAVTAAKVSAAVARLKIAISEKDRFAAEPILSELDRLISDGSRMNLYRTQVAALPWPKTGSLDLGDGLALDFVWIQPGSFMMGSDSGDADEKPLHKVTLGKSFYMGRYEVTQAQWEKVMGDNPSDFKGPRKPVEQVSWSDCQEFFRKLNRKIGSGSGGACRLPTEAEWEYSCRAGTTTRFCAGEGDSDLDKTAWYIGTASNYVDKTGLHSSKTHDVGGKAPNGWGLYDMHGNVWEWCQDWKGDYSADAVTDPKGPASASFVVFRGGSWNSMAAACRSANRDGDGPAFHGNHLGFRVVWDVSP